YITNYTKPASSDFFSSLNGDYEYVLIHGDGSDKCYAGIDVSGKIALIERGGITFEEKLRSAERAGAAGAIIFDNLTDGNLITMEDGGCSVPSLFVSRSDGLLLASAAGGTVSVIHDTIAVPTDNPDGISSFSSHGATPELKLKPDLTAPGGYIYSSADGGGYKYMSGTSMASPHAAAAYMLTEKNLNSRGLSRDLVLPLLMSSAHLIYDRESGVPVSPRAQGAGLVNVNSALNSELIMYAASENGDKAAKIELSDGTSGRLEFDIVIENIGTRQLGVRLSASIQSDGAFFSDSACDYFVAEHPEAFTGAKVYAAGIEKNININSEDFKKGSYVRIFPGEAKTVRICVILDSGEIEKKLEIFKNGFFTEGFVIAETSDGMQTASIPYMGFYGSWGELDAIDTSFYECGLTAYDDTSENGVVLFGSGDNAAFSPGKDGRFDSIGINLNLTRSVRSLSIDISDSEGNTVYQGKKYYNVKKAYAEDGVLVPSVASYVWDGSDGINSRFKYDDGQYYVNVRLTPAFPGAPTQTFSFCITVDTEAPEAVVSYVNRKITLSAHDGHLISSVRVYAPGAGDLGKVSYNSETASGDVVFSCDIPDGFSGKFVYAEVTDFAANKKVVILRLDKAERSR
ncbi:MAG: S8 family serine peptidase, partial [Firmicutes bacterium]|nr:S8 family serine peptidase [Bacillota bacterium]